MLLRRRGARLLNYAFSAVFALPPVPGIQSEISLSRGCSARHNSVWLTLKMRNGGCAPPVKPASGAVPEELR